MLVFYLLLTAVFSHTTGQFQVHESDSSDLQNDQSYVGVNILDVKPSEAVTEFDVPVHIELRFSYEELYFHLFLRNKPKTYTDAFQWVFIGNGTVNDQPVDFVAVRFPLKTLDTFSAQVSQNGHVYRFKPSWRVDGTFKETVVGAKRANAYIKQVRRARRNLNIIEFEDCWAGQADRLKQVELGYVVDPPFVDRIANVYAAQISNGGLTLKEAVDIELDEISADTNAIYTPQLNVIIEIAQVIDQSGLYEEQMTQQFQLGCGRQISNYLETLAQWRQTIKPNTYGLWKLLTDCYPPPGTIGIAYVAQLCSTYGVGVTTWTGDGTWQTDAHEIGHIFGAGHSFENGQGTTGGIMDYGDGFFDGVYQFNPLRYNDLCNEISSTMANPQITGCWTDLSLDQEVSYTWIKKTENDVGGTWGECQPEKGNYRLVSSDYKCIRSGNPNDVVDNDLCDLGNKPIHGNSHQIAFCDSGSSVPINAVCGDNILEHPEECEPGLVDCCTQTCLWDTSPNCAAKIPKVDAAYVDNSGKLYLFQDNQVYRYPSIDAVEVDTGFPREITTMYPGLTATSYTTNIDAAFMKPGESLLYLFQGLTYVVYDTVDNLVQTTNTVAQQVDGALLGDCGTIHAAIGFRTEMWLFCESVYNIIPHGASSYTVRRPVHDLDFDWPEDVKTYISAAVHDYSTGRSRFWNANQVIEWSGHQIVPGYPLTTNGLGETATITTPINCADHCISCNSPSVCDECEEGYKLVQKRVCVDEALYTWLQFNALQSDNIDQEYIKGGQQKLDKLLEDGKLLPGLTSTASSDDGLAMYFDGSEELQMNNIGKKMDSFSITAYYKPDVAIDADQRFVTFNKGKDNEFYIAFTSKPACLPPSGCSCVSVVHPSVGPIEAKCGHHFLDGSNLGAIALATPFCYAEGTCEGLTPSATVANAEYVECTDILCSDVSTFTEGDQFEIEVRMPTGSTFTCFVDEPLESDKWNKVSFEITPTEIKTGVNGVYHVRAFAEQNIAGEDVESLFEINDWTIGQKDGGISGTLDHFQLLLNGSASASTESANAGAVAATVIFILIAIFCVGFCIMHREGIKTYYEDYQQNKSEPQSVRRMSYTPNDMVMYNGTTKSMATDVKMIPQLEQESPFYSRQHGASNIRVPAASVQTITETELPYIPETPEWYYSTPNEEAVGPMSLNDVAEYVQAVGWETAYETYIWHPEQVPEWSYLQNLPQVINDIQSVLQSIE